MAASGLSFIARSDGKNPATIPTSTAKITAENASQGGIKDKFVISIPILFTIVLMIKEII